MEYVQMTLDDWIEIKRKLRQELQGVKQSFVRIGYALRQIDDQGLYRQDGYTSIAEFAQKEYGLEPSTTSRFIHINKEYSIDGYSEILRPEFADLGRSQLEEMLKLPEGDREMIRPETSREDIRELKRFNKAEPAAGVADDINTLLIQFYRDNKDLRTQIAEEQPYTPDTIKRFTEIVNPSGNRSYKKGLYFLLMYDDRVSVKKFGEHPRNLTWWEMWELTQTILAETEWDDEELEITEEHQEPEKTTRDTKADRSEEIRTETPEEDHGKDLVGEEKTDSERTEETPQSLGNTIQSDKTEDREEIAPAQSELEKTPEMMDEEPKETQEDQEEEPGDILTRKDYIDTLTAYGLALYLTEQYKSRELDTDMLQDKEQMLRWLKQKTDDTGRTIG